MKFLLIGCGAVLFIGIIAAGVAGYFGYREYKRHVAPIVRKVEESVKKLNFKVEVDSNKVKTVARKIMNFQIPGGSTGDSAINVEGFKLAVVEGKSEAAPVTLVLLSFPPRTRGGKWEEVHKIVMGELGPIVEAENFTPEETSHEKKNLCGKPVQVEVEKGWVQGDKNAKTPAIAYKTKLDHDGNQILVVIEASGNSRKTTARKVLDSLSCP